MNYFTNYNNYNNYNRTVSNLNNISTNFNNIGITMSYLPLYFNNITYRSKYTLGKKKSKRGSKKRRSKIKV
jgi:hypothetical protein